MEIKRFHITNGTSLTNYLVKLNIASNSDILSWQETLCIGPTI